MPVHEQVVGVHSEPHVVEHHRERLGPRDDHRLVRGLAFDFVQPPLKCGARQTGIVQLDAAERRPLQPRAVGEHATHARRERRQKNYAAIS